MLPPALDGRSEGVQQVHRIVDIALRLLQEHGCQYRHDLVAAAKNAYDTFVRPIDLPGVPNLVIEPKVDDMLCQALVMILETAADALCGEEGMPGS